LSCETGLIPRCRSYSEKEKATSSHGEWLAWEEPRAVGDLVHVAPNGEIYLVMRLYWPKTEAPSILPPGTGSWQPPGIKKV
jgi:hypothetical protein